VAPRGAVGDRYIQGICVVIGHAGYIGGACGSLEGEVRLFGRDQVTLEQALSRLFGRSLPPGDLFREDGGPDPGQNAPGGMETGESLHRLEQHPGEQLLKLMGAG